MMNFAVGQPVPRTEDPRLLRGHGNYVDDVNLRDQAYAFMVRSPHAHAQIKSIDTAEALSMPGVLAILTGAEYAADGLGFITGPTPYKRRDGAVMYRPPRPALTADRVRHVGQIAAVVVAETVDQAKDAAEAVEIDYEPLPVNALTGEARQAAAIWDDCADNESFRYEVGDKSAMDAAVAGAAHVIRQRYVINRITANTMEPRGALADYDTRTERYTIYTGVQRPYAWRATLAKNLFHVRESQIRFITGDLGGSFGMKGAIYPEVPLVAWASKRLGRPVKWRCERSEGFPADDHARDNVSDVTLALDENGKFLAMGVETSAALGAYVAFLGMGAPTGNVGGLAGVYMTPAMHVAVSAVLTNTSPTSPYRGAGRPEASYILERTIDIAARTLGIDPVALRRRNMIPSGQMPYKTPLTFTYDCGEFEAVLDKTLAKADYDGFAARRAESESAGKLRGIGISCTIERAAAAQLETAELRFDPSGDATILIGTTPHGQGHETIYKQIVCGALGLDPENVRVIEGDTDAVSFGTGTGGSRTATIGSGAVLKAMEKVIDKTKRIAAHTLEAAPEDIAFEDGQFSIVGTDRGMTFLEAAALAFDPSKLPPGMEPTLAELASYTPEVANYPNGCHIVEVEITPETGEIALDRYSVVDDCGFELNPLLVKGQVHGGIAQGVGQALMENMVYDQGSGQLLSGSFMDYSMPRAGDFCALDVGAHPVLTETNPLGVKGVGEAGTVGALAAVMNAINDALSGLGITHFEMPATPDRVWKAIAEARASSIEGPG
ncbi:MAG: molybdopterin-dependent oxidoreductase [Alphaproteobacteria bacterium]|nr:molybdopterin-dependent oxidoreductase [Alphaproteobacteria bacterium]